MPVTASEAKLRRRLVVSSPVLLLGIVPLAGNWSAASRREDATTSAFARDLLNSVEPYAVLITAGDNDTFPLWYAQEVEGVRRDVTVAVTSLMNTDWFARGMIRRPIHEYDAARGPTAYRDRTWPRPSGPPLHLTMEEADSLPPYFLVTNPVRFQARGLDVIIDPRALPQARGGGILERADLLVLRMIADTWPERPVYISRTAGNYAESLGLGRHTLSQAWPGRSSPRQSLRVTPSTSPIAAGSTYHERGRSGATSGAPQPS